MRVLPDDRAIPGRVPARILAVASRGIGAVGHAHREAVIASEPDLVRPRIPDDAVDAADLFAPLWLVLDDVGAAEDVVVHHRDAGAVQRHAICVAALVHGRVSPEFWVLRVHVGDPRAFAAGLALV